MTGRRAQVGPRWFHVLVAGVLAVGGCAAHPVAPTGSPPATSSPASVHLALGTPTDSDPSDDLLLDHQVFVVSYNPTRRVANWVAWRLVADDLGQARRQDNFHADELLPRHLPAVLPRDYTGSGYDRGHLCPSGDRTKTQAENLETFVMTNMHPQAPALNRGPWKGLEEHARRLAGGGRQVFIVAGGLFEAAGPTIGPGVSVPCASFKILVVLERGQRAQDVDATTTTYAVIMPNSGEVSRTRWPKYLASIDEVERQSGYDFMSRVPKAIQRVIEASAAGPPALTARP